MDRSMAVELTAQAPEQTRALYPDESGYRARRRQPLLGGVRRRRADRPPHADVVDHPLAPLEDADSLPGAALPRADVRRPRQRPIGPAGRARRVPRGGVRRTRSLSWMRRPPSAPCSSRSRERRSRTSPRAGRSASRSSCSSRRLCRCRRSSRRRGAGVRRAARRVRRLGEVEPPLLGRELRGLPRVLLLAVLHGAALDEAAQRTRSAGAETTAETLVATQLAPRLQDEEGVLELLARVRCPVLVIHSEDAVARARPARGLAELAGGELVVLEGSGHLPHARDPSRSISSSATS